MYHAIQNKKYYLAINTFKAGAKRPPYNETYLTGFRRWESPEMKTWAIVLGTFRLMFGIKKTLLATQG